MSLPTKGDEGGQGEGLLLAERAGREPAPDPNDRVRARPCVLRYARHATSFQILKREFHHWFDEPTGGLVGYVRHLKHRIVAGAPVGPRKWWPEMLRRFVADAAVHGDRVLFFSADLEVLAALQAAELDWDGVQIGLQPEWEPTEYHTRGSDRRSMRSQCNRARNKGVTVRELSLEELDSAHPTRHEVDNLIEEWLDARRMAVMRFVVELTPFEDPEYRRYFAAEDDEGVAAFLVATPVPGRDGWFFENVVRRSNAPNGSVELLIDQTMRKLAAEGAGYATLGLAPLAGLDKAREVNSTVLADPCDDVENPETAERALENPGRGDGNGGQKSSHPLLHWLFTMSYQHLGFVYSFRGLYRFKKRINPDVWAPQYAVRVGGSFGLIALLAILLAFAGRLPHFLADTVHRMAKHAPVRFWAAAVGLMGALLIPWTLLLSQIDGARWFGSEWVRDAWIVFDSGMVAALALLFWLLWNEHQALCARVALFLAGLTTFDFALTVHGALTLDHSLGFWSFWPVLAGTLAPLIATLLLIGVARFGAVARNGSG